MDSPSKPRLQSSVVKLVAFSLFVATGMIWWLLSPASHDPQWHAAVLPTRRPLNQSSVVSLDKPVATAAPPRDPFALVRGVDYFADYEIYNVSRPPLGWDYDDGRQTNLKFRYMNSTTSKYPFRWISAQPRVALVPNFLTEEECDELVHISTPRMERSMVVPFKGSKSSPIDEVRTSSQTWVDVNNGIGKQVADRLLELTGFPRGSSEMMQILRYEQNQKYDAHNDYFDPKFYGPQPSNRAVTAFLYLSTVEEGGHTWFPDADGKTLEVYDYKSCRRGMGFKPRKGYVVVFYDMMPNGEFDPRSLHGGCPVKKGVKWGGTLWLRINTAS